MKVCKWLGVLAVVMAYASFAAAYDHDHDHGHDHDHQEYHDHGNGHDNGWHGDHGHQAEHAQHVEHMEHVQHVEHAEHVRHEQRVEHTRYVERRWNDHDHVVMRGWYDHHRNHLPPGLARRYWLRPEQQRYIVVHQVLPVSLRAQVYAVPVDFERELPPAPMGCRHVFVGGQVLLVDAHFTIMDVFHF